MTEVENLSNQATEPVGFDVRRALRQHLECLRQSGLVDLPSGTGRLTFDSDDSVEATAKPVEATAKPVEPVPSNGSSMVRETSGVTANSDSVSGKQGTVPVGSTMGVGHKDAGLSSEKASMGTGPVEKPNYTVTPHSYGQGLSLADRKAGLSVLQSEVSGCSRCTELSDCRTQTVFGVGNPAARLVFLGEGPGGQEDRVGEPFVGPAGQLLDKIFSACKILRSDVYILNTIKCRPPANRNPTPEELANCWGFAERQLEILQPEFICCLGSVAAKTLLNTTQSLGRLRKKFHDYRGSKVLVTYHPAYLLRTPSAKKHVWEDMKMLMHEMGVELSN